MFPNRTEQDIVDCKPRVDAASLEALQLAADAIHDSALAEAIMRRLIELSESKK